MQIVVAAGFYWLLLGWSCVSQIVPTAEEVLLGDVGMEDVLGDVVEDEGGKMEDDEKVKIFREEIKKRNEQVIKAHNSNENKTHEEEANQFAVLTEDEINQLVLTLLPTEPLTLTYAKSLKADTDIIIRGTSETFNRVPETDTLTIEALEEVEVSPPSTEEVLARVRSQLLAKNIPEKEIDEEILSKYSNPNVKQNNILSTSPSRFLQEEEQQQKENLDSSFDVDWTCVSGTVRYQGKCGSCYAFAPLQAYSAMVAIYYYTFFLPFSPQQVVDCARNNLAFGCRGGYLEGAFSYMKTDGISTAYHYPYVNQDNAEQIQPCQKDQVSRQANFKIRDFVEIKKGDCEELMKKLQHHPIAVGIAGRAILYYKRGVVKNCDKAINHAVLVVGKEAGKGWKIKNSWGKNWGEEGYGWISEENNCQICEMAQYPIPNYPIDLNYSQKKRTCD